MDRIQKIISSSDMTKFISVKYVYGKLGNTLLMFLMLLTAISIKPAFAEDKADNKLLVENQTTELTSAQNIVQSIVDKLKSESHISLRQKLLASKKHNTSAKLQPSINGDFSVKLQPETFSKFFAADNLLLASENVLETNDSVTQQLLTSNNNQVDLPRQEQSDLLPQKQPETIEKVDSSVPVSIAFGDSDRLRQDLLIDPIIQPQEQPIQRRQQRAYPASTAGTPSAYGASQGQVYFGIGLVMPLDEDSEGFLDGSYSAGFGLGNAVKSVGLEVNVNIASAGGDYLKGGRFDVADSGYLGLKLHRYFPDGTAVAVGWTNPVKWGESSENKNTLYGVVTRAFALQPNNPNHRLPLTISLGYGNGGFRTFGTRETDENNANVFGSLGLRVIPQASLISSWTGNSLNIGSSIAPFKNTPIVINAIFTDLTRNFDRGVGFSVSAGYAFQF
ncbi:MAG: hypothetical protein EA343_11335 [Nodularia sp. (in: Bacteria)]|nr:MAG: hypothetical protein EA343_11335 [Nodularia sp. (in: cyanobacteria)]